MGKENFANVYKTSHVDSFIRRNFHSSWFPIFSSAFSISTLSVYSTRKCDLTSTNYLFAYLTVFLSLRRKLIFITMLINCFKTVYWKTKILHFIILILKLHSFKAYLSRVSASTVKVVEMLNLAKTLRSKEDGLIERGCCEEFVAAGGVSPTEYKYGGSSWRPWSVNLVVLLKQRWFHCGAFINTA